MNLKLKNKRAFITGSTSGIGYAIAKILIQEGADVILNGRSQKRIDKAIQALKESFPKATISGLKADFRDFSSINSLTKNIGQVDILINNVGIFSSKSYEKTSDADWQDMFDVNVMSSVRLSRALLPKMIEKNWGRIIFISSECAFLVPEDMIAYSTTKTAMLTISRGLAQTTRGTEVTINSIVPGSTLTEGAKLFLKNQAKKNKTSVKEEVDNFFKNTRTTSLLERFAEPSEIANMVAFLSSPLSSATNGSTIKVDGGSTPGIY